MSSRGTPYRAVAPIGQGGMGQVVEAVHIDPGKPYAVTLLHSDLVVRPDFAAWMRIEAQALALLAHPNLVGVRDLADQRSERLTSSRRKKPVLPRSSFRPRAVSIR